MLTHLWRVSSWPLGYQILLKCIILSKDSSLKVAKFDTSVRLSLKSGRVELGQNHLEPISGLFTQSNRSLPF